MDRRGTGPVVAVLGLLVAGGVVLGLLGWRSLRLEEEDGRRRMDAQRRTALESAAERAGALGLSGPFVPGETFEVAAPLPPFERAAEGASPSVLLLVEQARFLERKGDAAAARAIWERLAEAPGGPRAVQAVAHARAGALARRAGDVAAARRHLEAIPDDPTMPDPDGAPVRLVALRQLAALGSDDGASLDALRALVAWAGRAVRIDGGADAADALTAALDDAAPRASPALEAIRAEAVAVLSTAPARRALARELEHAPRAHALGLVGTRLPDGRVLARPLTAFAEELSATVGTPLTLEGVPPLRSPTATSPAEAPAVRAPGVPPQTFVARLAPPLDDLWAISRPDPAASPPARSPWPLVAGLGLYALGAGLAITAILRSTKAARMQADFVAATSHEMKTPIAGVQAMAEMLATGRVPDPTRARLYAERIHAEMARLGATVRNVLDAARIERAAETVVRLRPLEPVDVVSAFVEGVRPALEGRGFRLEVETRAAGRAMAVDPDALEHVLGNLVDNAAKFAETRREIEVHAGPRGDGFRIEVRDRGPGVPEEERERVFRRFERGARARERALPGVGLGLHVARALVRAHGGTLAVEGREGGGATFVVDLPGGRT